MKAPTSCLCLPGHLSWTGGKADRSPTATEAVGALSQAAGSLSRYLAATSRLATSRLPSGMERHGWVHSARGPCTSLGSPEKQNQQERSYLIDRYIDTQIDTKTEINRYRDRHFYKELALGFIDAENSRDLQSSNSPGDPGEYKLPSESKGRRPMSQFKDSQAEKQILPPSTFSGLTFTHIGEGHLLYPIYQFKC